jgi:uncharacterized protein YeaO (DUF488 family)
MAIRLKRAYEKPATDDGYRVLVDRLWPRGISKRAARIDLWLKDIAPSSELRKWFAHDPKKWSGFRARYFRELDAHPEAVERLRELTEKGDVTLIFGAKDQEHNDAVALKDYLERQRKKR